MARPTLTTVHTSLCEAMATALGLSTVAKLHPSWGRPEGAVPMAALGWQSVDESVMVVGARLWPATWRLSYYGQNERQLLAAADGLRAWIESTGDGWSISGHACPVSLSDISRQTPESGLQVEAHAFDATLIVTY